MQAEFAGRADVHGGAFAHGFHAAEDFDGVGGVVSVGGFAVVILRADEFCLQFFGGHSAPWRKPDTHPSGPNPGPLGARICAWLDGRFRDCSGESQLIEFSAI